MKAGVKAVIAESYARIFYRNSVDGGFLVPLESYESIMDKVQTGDEIEINLNSYELHLINKNTSHRLKSLGDVLPVVEAGGLFKYARLNGMIST